MTLTHVEQVRSLLWKKYGLFLLCDHSFVVDLFWFYRLFIIYIFLCEIW